MVIQVECVVLDIYIHLSKYRGHELFYLFTWIFWCRLSSWWRCCIPIYCSWVSHFIEILLVRCCLQMVAVATTWSKNFSAASFPLFTWDGSKYHPSLHFTKMLLPHGTWCWYWVVNYFDDDGSRKSCLRKTLSKSAQMTKGSRYSVFLKLTLSCRFLSSASGSLILCIPCNLHISKWFFNVSSLIQQCKQYWQKYFLW